MGVLRKMKKKIIRFIICLIFILSLIPLSQADINDSNVFDTNDNTWIRIYGGLNFDAGSSIQQTKDGGYIVVGETCKGITKYKNSDVWLVKTDGKGVISWEKTFGGRKEDSGSYVTQTIDGGYIIVGKTLSYGNGRTDVWLIRTDENGEKLWDKTFGYSVFDSGSMVKQTSDGSFIIVGNVNTSGGGRGDIWLIKVDSNGDKLWDKTFGGKGHNYGDSLQLTSDGGFIIVGSSWIRGETDSYDIWLIRTDNYGNILWDKKYHNDQGDHGWSLQQTSDGGFIIVGMTESGAGADDVWLFKTDSYGEIIWDKVFGDVGQNRGYAVIQTIDGGYILAGDTNKNYRMEALLIKTDSYGNKIWRKTYGGLGNDIFVSVQQTSDGGYILTGYETTFGNSNLWLVKTDSEGNTPRKYNRRVSKNSNLNLKAVLRPYRKMFPRVFYTGVIAQFDYGYMCYGEPYEGGGNITFQIKRIIGREKELISSESWEIMSEDPGSGRGKVTGYHCYVDEGYFNIYEAKTILRVEDDYPLDNEASLFFIVVDL
jgi:hypothetical protein